MPAAVAGLVLALASAASAQDAGEAAGTAPTSVEASEIDGPTLAEEAGDADVDLPKFDSDIEEIKVWGERGGQTALPEATAATEITGADFDALQVADVADIANFVPNLEIQGTGGTTANFFIRGVGLSDFSANSTGAVAIIQDGVFINAPALQLGQLFDVRSVQVLKGPVSGGSFRNASAGAIVTTSRRPSHDFEASLRMKLGSIVSDDAVNAFRWDTEGALNMPVVEDVLAARFAFRIMQEDPFITNGCGDLPPLGDRPPPVRSQGMCGERAAIQAPAGLPSLIGENQDWALRGSFLLEPLSGSDMTWLLNGHGSRLARDSGVGQLIGTNGLVGGGGGRIFGSADRLGYRDRDQTAESLALRNSGLTTAEARERLAFNLAEGRPLDTGPYRGDYNKVGRTIRDTWGATLQGDFYVGDAAVRSITAYDGYERSAESDADFSPNPNFERKVTDTAWQLVQDLNVSGEIFASWDAPIRWRTGGWYIMEELAGLIEQEILSSPGASFERPYQQDLWGWALHGGFDWDLLDDFTLRGEARYNWERKRFAISHTPENLAFGFAPRSVQTETWQEPTWSVDLTYRFGDLTSVYGKYSRGFKPGHFNTSNPFGEDKAADRELIDAYEWGLKLLVWEERVHVQGALFFYDYADYQVFRFQDVPNQPPTREIINASDATILGAEVDILASPLEGYVSETWEDLQLALRFGWLESKFLDFQNTELRSSEAGVNPVQVVIDFSGAPLIASPNFQVSGSATYTIPLGRYGTIVPRYDFSWTDDIFFDATGGRGSPDPVGRLSLPEFAIAQKAYALHHVRLSYRTPSEHAEVSAYCQNVADTRYRTFAFDATAFSRATFHFVAPPRTCGAELQLSW